MTTCSGYHLRQSSEGLYESPILGAGRSSRGFPCADLYSSFSTRMWQYPQTRDFSSNDLPAKFQMSFFVLLLPCLAPGPWQVSHPIFNSDHSAFWALGLAGSYAVSR